MRNIRLYFGLLCFVLLSACDRADDITGDTYHTDVFKVSVIAPDHLLPYWERTAEWAQEILHRAQVGMDSRVKVELEFHNENELLPYFFYTFHSLPRSEGTPSNTVGEPLVC